MLVTISFIIGSSRKKNKKQIYFHSVQSYKKRYDFGVAFSSEGV